LKFALLSDIHGNSFALKAVLDAVKKKKIKTLIITGDFVGYYFWPLEVFKILKGWHIIAVRGNHDKMLEVARKDKDFLVTVGNKYGSGLRRALDQLDKKTIDWLIGLPDLLKYKTKDGGILLCHGSPWGEDEYVYPDLDNQSLDRYISLDEKWVIQGHTHYPMYKEIANTIIINPGSVGQPRSNNIGAQWALLDTKLKKVEFFCEQYDVDKVVIESLKKHPELPYLANILKRE
jgi:putative phosphoesterase